MLQLGGLGIDVNEQAAYSLWVGAKVLENGVCPLEQYALSLGDPGQTTKSLLRLEWPIPKLCLLPHSSSAFRIT